MLRKTKEGQKSAVYDVQGLLATYIDIYMYFAYVYMNWLVLVASPRKLKTWHEEVPILQGTRTQR